jgi:hypothetical protein
VIIKEPIIRMGAVIRIGTIEVLQLTVGGAFFPALIRELLED